MRGAKDPSKNAAYAFERKTAKKLKRGSQRARSSLGFGVRTAVGKAGRGSLKHTRPEDLGGIVVQEALQRVPGLDAKEIDDVIIGCAMPEGEQGLNLGRIVAVRAGLPNSVPGMTVNRFCSSGLQSIALAAERIMCGFADVIIAGGVESMSWYRWKATVLFLILIW